MQTFSIFGPNFYGTPSSQQNSTNNENFDVRQIFSRLVDFLQNILNYVEPVLEGSEETNHSTTQTTVHQNSEAAQPAADIENPLRSSNDDYVVSELLFFDNNSSLGNGMTITEINENSSLESVESSDEDFICSICQNQIENSIYRKITPCGHCFHVSCIDNWLVGHNTCPYCRINLTPERPQSSSRRNLSNLVSLRLFPNTSES